MTGIDQARALAVLIPAGLLGGAYISEYGFDAAFGQQSGVAHANADLFNLPRFTMTENFSNIGRFQMTANALPLPVTDLSPNESFLTQTRPSIGFTIAEDIPENIENLSCFASGQSKPEVNIVGMNRVEIRLAQDIDETRFRVNCTLPENAQKDREIARWRWFGLLMTLDETALNLPSESR